MITGMEDTVTRTSPRRTFRRTPRADARDQAAARVRQFDARNSEKIRDRIRQAIASVTQLAPSRQ